MVWSMCSLENLQVKVLSRVVVVFTWANASMYINLFVKSNNLLKRILTLKKTSKASFLMKSLLFSKSVLLGDDLIIILIIKYSYSPSSKRSSSIYQVFLVFSSRGTGREELPHLSVVVILWAGPCGCSKIFRSKLSSK